MAMPDAGVPLARIRELRASPDTDLRQALHDIDAELTIRIRDLRRTPVRSTPIGEPVLQADPASCAPAA